MYDVASTRYIAAYLHCTVYAIHCIAYSVPCMLNDIRCTVHYVLCMMYCIWRMVWSICVLYIYIYIFIVDAKFGLCICSYYVRICDPGILPRYPGILFFTPKQFQIIFISSLFPLLRMRWQYFTRWWFGIFWN